MQEPNKAALAKVFVFLGYLPLLQNGVGALCHVITVGLSK